MGHSAPHSQISRLRPGKTRAFLSAAVLAAVLAPFASASAQDGRPTDATVKTSGSAIDIATRPGVTLRYMAFKPAGKPRAGAILFVGGQGAMTMPDRVGATWQSGGNFLPRAREHFLRRDLFVALVNPPSDHAEGYGTFRTTAAHAEDIAAVVADVRRRVNGAPVWLVGTSRGTISVVNVAARLADGRGGDGIVLTSSVTRPATGRNAPPGNEQTVYAADLGAIRVPALVVHHRHDKCSVSLAGDAPALLAKLANAPRKDLLIFEGGGRRGDECGGMSAHGFLEIERRVVDAIADWMFKP
jgi:pimeloyl-ACP methyl ester carboxylesterase